MTLRRWLYAGLAALVLIELAAPFLLYPDHPHFSFEDLPGWGSLFGLVACVAIIVVSKLLGKLALTRRETYYDS
jgi:hypothetical protein